MTVRELIVALTRVDPDTQVRLYDQTSHGDSLPVVGVDPYETATVLVAGDDD